MTFKKKILLLSAISVIMIAGCGEYRTFSGTIKVTLVPESEAEVLEEIITENISETVTTVKITEPFIESSEEHKIYRTKSGKSYHYENPCGRGTYYECTLEEALKDGLEPCKKCIE